MSERLVFGKFTLEPSLQRLTSAGRIVPLKPKAWDLLCQLLDNRNRVVSKDELMEWLWPRQDIAESNLTQTVYEVRRALEDRSRDAQWIETVPRRGYRFVGEVTASSDSAAQSSLRSLAILPFLELGPGSGKTQHNLGIADALITTLAGSGGLVVRPLSAILRYAAAEQDPLLSGRQLQVDAVVEGSLRAGESGIRVAVRLLQVADGACLWADQFTVPASDPFALEDAISGRVAAAVASVLTGSAAATGRRRSTDDPEVHLACMKGWYCWHKWTKEAWLQAIRHFQHALKFEPEHAPALAGLAAAWSTLGIHGISPPREAFIRAREAAIQAVTLSPDYSQGHEMMGAIRLFHDWDFAEAGRCLDRAIELAPDNCTARDLRALALAAGGHNAPAVAEIRYAAQLDPQSLITRTDVGYILYWGRRFQEAEQSFRAVLELNARFGHARHGLACVLAELGEFDQALCEMRKAAEQSGRDSGLSGDLAWLLGRMGRVAEAEEIIGALASQGRRDYLDPLQLAVAHIGLGDHDRAFEMLDLALQNRSRDLITVKVNPVMDPIRTDPRYRPFLEVAGLL